jgi:signal transduction histidine kinase
MLMGMRDRPPRSFFSALDRRPFVTDGAIVVAFTLFGWASVAFDGGDRGRLSADAALGVMVVALPLLWRRRAPVAALAAFTLAFLVYQIAGLPSTFWYANAWVVAAYSAGAYGRGRWRDPVRIVSSVALIVTLVYGSVVVPAPGIAAGGTFGNLLVLVANAAIVVWVWPFGDAIRQRREREDDLMERTRQLERERELGAQRAVLAERVRIARELHDVLAHHVSLMGVQAGAARRVLSSRPDQVEPALRSIEAASREAVRELHRLLGFLRRDAEERSLAPQPSLDQIEALLEHMREAGLPVTLLVEGTERPLPAAVDLSAYRIIQEALTNTLRHAGATSASVRLRYGEQSLRLMVSDDGHGPIAAAHRPGSPHNGLLGMRERTALLGGRLTAGPGGGGGGGGGGFVVDATLPFDRVPS